MEPPVGTLDGHDDVALDGKEATCLGVRHVYHDCLVAIPMISSLVVSELWKEREGIRYELKHFARVGVALACRRHLDKIGKFYHNLFF